MKLLLSALLLATINASYAEDPDCGDIDNLKDADIPACLERSTGLLQTNFAVTKGFFAKDRPAVAAALETAQTEWGKYRDQQCAFEVALDSDEKRRDVDFSACVMVENLLRADYLQTLTEPESPEEESPPSETDKDADTKV